MGRWLPQGFQGKEQLQWGLESMFQDWSERLGPDARETSEVISREEVEESAIARTQPLRLKQL